MKTRTLLGLVFGLALLGPLSLCASTAAASPDAKSEVKVAPAVATNTPAIVQAPVEPPERAAVTPLPQPAKQLPAGVSLSGWVGELVKLAESGIDQGLMFTFIDSAGTFNLGVDHIIYLHDIGVPSEVITAVIQHDAEIASGVRQSTAPAPPGRVMEVPLPPLTPAPLPNVSVPEPALPYTDLPGEDEANLAVEYDFFDDWSVMGQKSEISPVRKPYPVQLTAPIVVFRTQGRIPNLMLLQTLP